MVNTAAAKRVKVDTLAASLLTLLYTIPNTLKALWIWVIVVLTIIGTQTTYLNSCNSLLIARTFLFALLILYLNQSILTEKYGSRKNTINGDIRHNIKPKPLSSQDITFVTQLSFFQRS